MAFAGIDGHEPDLHRLRLSALCQVQGVAVHDAGHLAAYVALRGGMGRQGKGRKNEGGGKSVGHVLASVLAVDGRGYSKLGRSDNSPPRGTSKEIARPYPLLVSPEPGPCRALLGVERRGFTLFGTQ